MVRFDANSYQLDTVPTWLLSGELHYFKLARGDWRRRLLQTRCAGFNTVSVYMPWNYHEIDDNQWEFSGDKDIAHFLDLAAELGLYVVARPGPYICDEWEAGGLPPFLTRKKGLRLRTADPQYLKHVDRWWDQVAPIIAARELGKGGTVILAQVENEYGHFGPYQEEKYIHHLRDGLRSRGITVPIINCDSFINFSRLQPRKYEGINLCANFGGDGLRNLARSRKLQPEAPLFVTEYWIAAFDWWGRNGSAGYDDQRALNGALEIAAGGAGGLTAFVFSGGAHFGYWHGCSICSDANFMTTLYGPGAPILDDGRFSGKYQLLKNALSGLVAAEFATAGMPEITEVSPGLVRAVRRSGQTEYVFHLNRSKEQIRIADQEKDQACVDLSIPAGSVHWTVRNLPLSGGDCLRQTNLQLFAAAPALVLYGDAGQAGVVELASGRIDLTVPTDAEPYHRRIGSLDLLVLNREAAERCWNLHLPGAPATIIGGPDRIEDAAATAGRLTVQVSVTEPRPCWQLTRDGVVRQQPEFQATAGTIRVPLSGFAVSHTFPEIAADYDAKDWFNAKQPQALAQFSHGHGRAWYRVAFKVTAAGPQAIHFSGAADRGLVWVDGRFIGPRGVRSHLGWSVMPTLAKGMHVLTVLVENLGMINSGAEFDTPPGEPKGLFGPVWLNGRELRNWQMRTGTAATETLDFWQKPGPDDWLPLADDEAKGPLWIKAMFALPAGFDGAVRFELGQAAGKGSVWVNGWNVGRYWNLGPQQSLWLPLSRLQAQNEVVLLEETRIQPKALTVELASFGCRADWRLAE